VRLGSAFGCGSGGVVFAGGRNGGSRGSRGGRGRIERPRKRRGEQAISGDLLPSRWIHVGSYVSETLAALPRRAGTTQRFIAAHRN
jgi:hypothetical protein